VDWHGKLRVKLCAVTLNNLEIFLKPSSSPIRTPDDPKATVLWASLLLSIHLLILDDITITFFVHFYDFYILSYKAITHLITKRLMNTIMTLTPILIWENDMGPYWTLDTPLIRSEVLVLRCWSYHIYYRMTWFLSYMHGIGGYRWLSVIQRLLGEPVLIQVLLLMVEGLIVIWLRMVVHVDPLSPMVCYYFLTNEFILSSLLQLEVSRILFLHRLYIASIFWLLLIFYRTGQTSIPLCWKFATSPWCLRWRLWLPTTTFLWLPTRNGLSSLWVSGMLLHSIAKTGFEDYFHHQSANNNALAFLVLWFFLCPCLF